MYPPEMGGVVCDRRSTLVVSIPSRQGGRPIAARRQARQAETAFAWEELLLHELLQTPDYLLDVQSEYLS